MKKYFKIELLSDLCCSDGTNFGSAIDRDIMTDEFGIPYISGKVLKGLLRECTEEYVQITGESDCIIRYLFGDEGRDNGNITIHDAHPANYNELIKDIRDNNIPYDLVRSMYTYIRGQTAINEDGTAKKGSLRITAVLKRGYSFICEYDIKKDQDEKILIDVLPLLRHMGMNRTRGLGEVKCMPITGVTSPANFEKVETFKNSIDLIIHTRSPLITKIGSSGNHIPAARLTGFLINRLGNDTVIDMLAHGLKISNAYISDGEKRFFGAPAYLAKTKEEQFVSNELQLYIFDTEKCDPMAMGYKNSSVAITENCLETLSVSVERSYHHRQDDNNPGVVDGDNFYTLSAISPLQTFIARIESNEPHDIKMIANSINDDHFGSMGYYKTSGFGDVALEVSESKAENSIETDTIAVYLHSPVITYDELGMPCTKSEVFDGYLINYLEKKCGYRGNIEALHRYVRFTNVIGYNHTWSKSTPSFEALSGGTVMVYKLDKSINFIGFDFMGERTSEGYGEFEILDYSKIIKKQPILRKVTAKNEKTYYPSVKGIDWELPSEIAAKRHADDECIHKALESADKKSLSVNPTTVGRLLLMLLDSSDYAKFMRRVDDIKDEKKKAEAKALIKLPDSISADEYMLYYKTFLTQIKYKKRGEKA